jgi:hypothetical protein
MGSLKGSHPRRFTPEDDARVREWFAAYVPVPEIAQQLGHSVGTIRQRIHHALKLHRHGYVSACLKWAPDHLRAQMPKMDPQTFRNACFAWRYENGIARSAAKVSRRAAKHAQVCADIDQNPDLDRDAKIRAKRIAGVTLQAIADQHDLTREQVRQLTTTGWECPAPPERGKLRKSASVPTRHRAIAALKAAIRKAERALRLLEDSTSEAGE